MSVIAWFGAVANEGSNLLSIHHHGSISAAFIRRDVDRDSTASKVQGQRSSTFNSSVTTTPPPIPKGKALRHRRRRPRGGLGRLHRADDLHRRVARGAGLPVARWGPGLGAEHAAQTRRAAGAATL